MSISQRLTARLRRESFEPGLLSLVFRPFYIIRKNLFLTISSLAPAVSGDILDFGCGSKPYEALFAGATTYVGVDLQATGHDHSDSKVDVFYDGKVLPFEDAQFDAVVSFEVLEHVFNLPDVLREISRVTRDKGYLLISIPFAWGEHEIPYDFARYTSYGITHILNAAGYEPVQTKKTTTSVLAVVQMFLAYLTQTAPRSRILQHLRQLFIVFPCTVVAYALNRVLPKRYEYYCNIVLLARKR